MKITLNKAKLTNVTFWAENRKDRKSNSGYIVLLNGGTISWACRKQQCVPLSTTEAEYVALTETCQVILWLRNLCKDFNNKQTEAIQINVDNQSCLSIMNDQSFSNRTKHIDTKYHFIKDIKNNGLIKASYCPTDDNVADLLTKPLGAVKLNKLRLQAGLMIIEEEC